MNLKRYKNEFLNETLFHGKHQSGLEVYVLPQVGYKKCYALFATKYGSIDSEFVVPSETEPTKVPDGIAHFLEHKLFEEPTGNVFDVFSKYGASANAYTSFSKTGYLFSSTSNIYESLTTLLRYVQNPYFTDENVEKEQGIIAQEIRMYEDHPGQRVFYGFLDGLYKNHPVKIDIAGTVESISKINKELLYRCYNTFYNLSNMVLFVVGNIDEKKVAECVDANILKDEPLKDEIGRIYPEEPDIINKSYVEKNMSVSIPFFVMGFKDIDKCDTEGKLFKKYVEMDILLKMLFGRSSTLYQDLYERGLIKSFGAEYLISDTHPNAFAFSALEGESSDPQKVYEIVMEYIDKLKKEGLSIYEFERIKKVVWGKHISLFNNMENIAYQFVDFILRGINIFDYYEVYKRITFEDVTSRFITHFEKDRAVLSVVKSKT